jgi:hypothetical protein
MSLLNPPATNSSNRNFWALFWVLVCLHQLYFGWFLVRSHFVPYVMDGNETFSVWWHAHNLYTFSFWKSFGLTDESYGLTDASHPFFHTHQGNMPRLFGFLIYALGARTVEAQVLVTTLVIGNLTLFFCYASIAKLTRPTIAFIFCLFLFSDYLLYAQWHVVTYRVWYGFLFFGTLFAISHAAPENRIWPYALLGLLFFLLFYFELVFAGYVSIVAGLYVLWLHWGSPKRIAALYTVQLIAGVGALVLLFSQLVLVFGVDVVKVDFSTTFLARNAATVDPTDSVGSFFRDHNIVFWNNFRDGNSLRTLIMFVRSIGFYIFQIWTPPFLILIGIPLIGVLVSFLQKMPSHSALENSTVVPDLKSGSRAYLFEARIVGPDALRRSISFHIPSTVMRWASWEFPAYVLAAVLALLALMLPGALFGLAPNRKLEIIEAIALEIATGGSLSLLVFASWANRPLLMSTCRGILATTLGALLIVKSHVLFDQNYNDIWKLLYEDWNLRLVLRCATILAFVGAAVIAVSGASASFGPEKKSSVQRVLIFLGIAFVAYTSIYVLSPGYVVSGYGERYAPFAIFFVAMVPAAAIYAMITAGQRHGEWLLANSQLQRRGSGVPVSLLVAIFIAAPALLWIRVQVYYERLFPPDHLAFLQNLKSPQLHGATFAVDNYAAPIAYYAGNWAYFDPKIGMGVSVPDARGNERQQDYSFLWFADKKLNAQYERAQYYVCMKMPNFDSALALSVPRRSGHRFASCATDRLLKQANFDDRLVLSDYLDPRFWSVVRLDRGLPKIASIFTTVRLVDGAWQVIPDLQLVPGVGHSPTLTTLQLLAGPGGSSCEVPEKMMKVVQENNNSVPFSLPADFRGVFRLRARLGSDVENGRWHFGDLWINNPDPSYPAGMVSRCLATVVDGSLGAGGLALTDKGWSTPESWGIWTIARAASLLPIAVPAAAINSNFLVEATVRAYVPKPGGVQQVTVRANGAVVAGWTLTDTQPVQEVSARIPMSAMSGHPALVLSFDISDPASPASFGQSPDTRQLGMGLIALKLTELEH